MPGAKQDTSSAETSTRLLSIFRTRKMPSLFNTIRFCVYVTVIVFTVICLALAANFQHVLASSDLTRFVPFSIFVCCAGMFIVSALLAFSFLKGSRNPISTRIELVCLGFAGLLWMILGIFLATSESQEADVECFSSEADPTTPLDESEAAIRTSAYQAMYRVLMVFAFFNAILLLGSFAVLLYLALRRYNNGDEQMWYCPVTTCPWLTSYGSSDALLPGPGGGKTTPPPMTERRSTRRSRHRRGADGSGHRSARYPTPIAEAHTAGRQRNPDLFRRDASPRRRT